jgi:hypothetical protein
MGVLARGFGAQLSGGLGQGKGCVPGRGDVRCCQGAWVFGFFQGPGGLRRMRGEWEREGVQECNTGGGAGGGGGGSIYGVTGAGVGDPCVGGGP